MKLSPQQAFQTGHDLGYCATYFDQVLLASRLANQKEDDAQQHAQNMIGMLQKIGPNFAKRLQYIDTSCKTLSMPPLKLPALPPEFYPWVQTRHNQFIENWTATDPLGLVFVLGHCLGELRNGFIIANISIDFEKNIKLDCSKDLQRLPARLRSSLERWKQAEALLSDGKLGGRFHSVSRLLETKLPTIINLLELPSLEEKSLAQAVIHKLLEVLSQAEQELAIGLGQLS